MNFPMIRSPILWFSGKDSLGLETEAQTLQKHGVKKLTLLQVNQV
jgi:hypothetical protein